MRFLLTGLLIGGALLAGCSNTRRCEGEQPYQRAETLPAPAAVPGLTIPDSPSALRIPPPPPGAVPYGRKVEDGKSGTRYECLDTPPRLPPEPAPAPAPAKP